VVPAKAAPAINEHWVGPPVIWGIVECWLSLVVNCPPIALIADRHWKLDLHFAHSAATNGAVDVMDHHYTSQAISAILNTNLAEGLGFEPRIGLHL
jgi:hypothetical protein